MKKDTASKVEKLKHLQNELSEIDKKLNKSDNLQTVNLSEQLKNTVKTYLRQISGVLIKVVKLSQNLLVIEDGRIVYNGKITRFPFNRDNASDVADNQIERINYCLQYMSENGVSPKYIAEMGKSLHTLYGIFDEADKMQDELVRLKERAVRSEKAELKARKREIQTEIEALTSEIKTSVEAEKKDGCLSAEEYSEREKSGKIKYSRTVPVGYFGEASDFVRTLFALEAKEGKGSAFIEVSQSYGNDDRFYDKIESMLIRAALEFGQNEIRFAAIENTKITPVLAPALEIHNNIFRATEGDKKVATDADTTDRLLKRLVDEQSARLSAFRSATPRVNNIADFNKNNPDGRKEYILLLINGFPELINNGNVESLESLLKNGGKVGIFAMIFGQNESIGNYGERKQLDFAELGTKFISINEKGIGSCDKKQFELCGGESFSREQFKKIIQARIANERAKAQLNKTNVTVKASSDAFYLNEIIEREAKVPFYKKIEIPIGKYEDGSTYYYTTSTEKMPYPFTLIVGTTGTGKSAVLHTLMMSGAMKYAPDELEFHLIDFKSSESSTEFSNYQYDKKNANNLYLPHVKYLSLRARAENALDVVKYIDELCNERAVKGKFYDYNKHVVEEGIGEKLPQIYVIIDEYRNMLNVGEDDYGLSADVKATLDKIIKRARAFGIGLIFCGPEPELPSGIMGQINNRIAYFLQKDSKFDDMFDSKLTNLKSLYPMIKEGKSEVPKKGYALCATNSSSKPEMVRMAFCGKTDIKDNDAEAVMMRDTAKEIRDKYRKNYGKTYGNQTVIGTLSSKKLNGEGEYRTWDEEYEYSVLACKAGYDNEHEFETSGSIEALKDKYPLAIGVSNSSPRKAYLDFASQVKTQYNYFAFANDAALCRIESNAAFAFLFQCAHLSLFKKNTPRVLFCDDEDSRAFDTCFGKIIDKKPFLKDYIEHVHGKREIIKRLVSLNRGRRSNKEPLLVIIHEIEWMGREGDALSATIPSINEETKDKGASEYQKQLESVKAKGITPPAFLLGMKAIPAQKGAEAVTQETLTLSDAKSALLSLHKEGNRNKIFTITSSVIYDELNDLLKIDGDKKCLDYAVYGSFDVLTSKDSKKSNNANGCYLFPARMSVRLYDYSYEEAKEWWDALEIRMK
ncbi:MAG: FtsK/SpoIIIE domain-containing protein [Candidatus Coproplasma sp.]